MKKILFFLFLVTLFIFAPKTAFAADFTTQNYIIKLNSASAQENLAKTAGINQEKMQKIANNTYKIELNDWQKTKIYLNSNTKNKIEYLEKDQHYTTQAVPNDALISNQWALNKISAYAAWDYSTGSADETIAQIDTGIDGEHEDLIGKITNGFAFLDSGETQYQINGQDNTDDSGHGTAIAGVMAGVTNNSLGIAGLGWQTKIMPLKVFKTYQWGYGAYSSDIALAIYYAADNGVKIINLSLGGQYPSTAIKDAIDYAYDEKGCTVIAAAGNEDTAVAYPAKYDKVIAVGATDSNDNRCVTSNCGYGSNYGAELDVMAPGVSILTTKNSESNNEYWYVGGTSIAAPYVSALASLILAKNPNFTNEEIFDAIKDNADKLDEMTGANFTNYDGYGRINGYASLNPGPSSNPNRYHSQWISQNNYPQLYPGENYNFSVSLKNTGTTTWYQNSVSLGTDRDKDRIPAFIRGDGWASANRVRMVQSSVAPGEIATFTFTYTVPDTMPAGVYREYFRPVVDGITWMEDYGIYWDITVLPGITQYHYSWVSQNAYPTLTPGQGYNFVVTVKNTGLATWKKDIVHLGTDRNQDRVSIFRREDLGNPYGNPSHWLSQNRVFMNEDTVAPGSNATFSFWMSPEQYQALGTYKEYFRLVADGIGWMEDYGISWDITVDNPHSQWVSQSSYPTLHPGESATVHIDFKNTGKTTWQNNGISPTRLGTSNQLDRTSIFKSDDWLSQNRISLDQQTVSPNDTGTFTFVITVPSGTQPGTYREYFRPVCEGINWLEDNGVFLDIIVN